MKNKINLLILEDVPLDAELAERELKREGMEFSSLRVETQKDFLKALDEFIPDIILADHSLPHFDGLSALKLTLKKSPHTPFIFLSGKIGEDFAVEMLKEGATDYVLKNNISKLYIAVSRALKEAKEQKERKNAEKALKEQEEEYRILVENQNDLIIKFDQNGNLLFVSNSFCELFGKDKEELLGKHFLEVVPQKHSDSTKSSFKQLFEPPYHGYVEQEIETFEGLKYISWANKAVMDENNEINAFVAVGRDITLQKKAEKALKESESKYRAIFENTGTLILIFEENMIISLVNEEFERFSLYPKDEIESKKSWLDFVASDDVERMLGYHRLQQINPHAIPKNYEVSLTNKKGEIKDFYATFDKIPGTNQNLISFMDITKRKIAENKIKDSLREKELLLREIHHRVKNNLQIISTLLTLQAAQVDDEKIIEMYRESQNRIQSIALIHEKLYQSTDISKINLQDYVQSMVSDLFFSFGTDKKLIDAELYVEDVLMNIETAIPCGLIINELLSNSLKHAFPHGKGKIIIKLQALDDGEYSLVVSDNGIGLPDNFDMENTDTLGLQIVNSLVDQIEGHLEISQPSKFQIKFKEIEYKDRL